MCSIIAAWILAASLGGAEASVRLPSGWGVDLRSRTVAEAEPIDVRLDGFRLVAGSGIRAEGERVFAFRADVVVGQTYRVKGADGVPWRVRLVAIEPGAVLLRYAPSAEEPPAPVQAELAGPWRASRMSIAGAGAAAVMPPLELEASGAYRFGSARGTWKVVEGAVVLSGHYAAWGPGRLRGGALCFSFKRGPWPVGVELRRPWDRRQPGGEDAGIASAVRPGPAGPR